jgi:hypothetical protein
MSKISGRLLISIPKGIMNNPLIELRIDPEEDAYVSGIALVEYPAIESNFIAFSKDQTKIKQLEFTANDDMMELIGLAMIPDVPIDRLDDDGEKYQVVFSADTIRYISLVYASKGLFNSTNIEHSTVPAHSVIFQSYITDRSKGMYAPNIIKDADKVPDGSWVVGVKVQSQSVWNHIKSGKIKGFSVEGMFQCFEIKRLAELSKQPLLTEIELAFKELEELEKELENIIQQG